MASWWVSPTSTCMSVAWWVGAALGWPGLAGMHYFSCVFSAPGAREGRGKGGDRGKGGAPSEASTRQHLPALRHSDGCPQLPIPSPPPSLPPCRVPLTHPCLLPAVAGPGYPCDRRRGLAPALHLLAPSAPCRDVIAASWSDLVALHKQKRGGCRVARPGPWVVLFPAGYVRTFSNAARQMLVAFASGRGLEPVQDMARGASAWLAVEAQGPNALSQGARGKCMATTRWPGARVSARARACLPQSTSPHANSRTARQWLKGKMS